MGLLSRFEKSEEEVISSFQDKGFSCSVVVGSAGHGGADRAGATLLFGIAGLAGTSGKKDLRERGRLYMKTKGLRFIPDKEIYLESRVLWEDIIHVGIDPSGVMSKLYLYTKTDGTLEFKINQQEGEIVKKIIIERSPLLKHDLEGWE